MYVHEIYVFFFSSRRRHTIFDCDWSSDVCSSDLWRGGPGGDAGARARAAGPGAARRSSGALSRNGAPSVRACSPGAAPHATGGPHRSGGRRVDGDRRGRGGPAVARRRWDPPEPPVGGKATGQPTGRLVPDRPQPYIASSGKHTHDRVTAVTPPP